MKKETTNLNKQNSESAKTNDEYKSKFDTESGN